MSRRRSLVRGIVSGAFALLYCAMGAVAPASARVAVVEQGDRLVDRGSATQALALLDLAAACAARDREKVEMAARPPLALP